MKDGGNEEEKEEEEKEEEEEEKEEEEKGSFVEWCTNFIGYLYKRGLTFVCLICPYFPYCYRPYFL